jgi:adenine/guanine phosphoribosyltransferase-like PRPP-binding protein
VSVAKVVIARDRATAHRESSSAAPELAEVAEYVRERPLTAIMVAAAAGFIFNGGMSTRVGRAITSFVVPIVLRSLITDAIVSSFTADHDRQAVPGRERSK